MADAALTAWLEGLSDSALDDVLRDWGVPHEVASLAAVAQWMRTPEAIDGALARTTAQDLAALAAGGSSPALEARGLTLVDGARSRIREAPEAPGSAAELPDDERRSAADRAVARTITMSGAVASIADSPVRLTARSITLASEQRARSAELSLTVEAWESLLETARADGLIAQQGRSLAVTPLGLDWLADAPADRWLRLRSMFLARRTLADCALLEGGLPGGLEEALPLAEPALLAEAASMLEEAEQLGLLQRRLPSGVTRADIDARIPDPVDYVYLQPDLTVVAPGPLTHDVEHRLATMAKPESRGVASSWRLTPASVQRALALGDSADDLLRALGELSRTGVPQPVEYLVRDTERRFGTLLVQEHGGPAASRVTTDAETHRRLLVDRSLADIRLRVPLGSDGADGVLVADVAPAETVDRLVDARYPALLADAEGAPFVPARVVADAPARPALSSLTARLRGHGVDVAGVRAEWLVEQLTAAAKQKTPVRITVVSGSKEHHTTVVPLSVANGRLRGRDIEHDIERTLPLRAITEVAGLHHS